MSMLADGYIQSKVIGWMDGWIGRDFLRTKSRDLDNNSSPTSWEDFFGPPPSSSIVAMHPRYNPCLACFMPSRIHFD